MTDLSHLSQKQLIEYAEGEVTTSQAEAVEEILSASSRDRRRLDDIESIMEHLGHVDEEISGIDLVAVVRREIDAMTVESISHTPKKISKGLISALAACILAAISTVLYFQLKPDTNREFTAKAAGPSTPERNRWIGIQGYRVVDGSRPQILTQNATLSRTDRLVFSYTNNGGNPFDYLMIFAIDERGSVFWYYPAFEKEHTDPTAISIRRDARQVALPDAVTHDYATGSIAIYGLFLDRPIAVSTIEKTVADEVSAGDWGEKSHLSLDIEGSALIAVKMEITK